MSPGLVITGLGFIAYGGLALLLAVAIGRTIQAADRQDAARRQPPCCPHPESEAPETVNGRFRAVVVPR